MATHRTTTVITLALLALFGSTAAIAYEVYHWIDENGVPNFSQEQPAGEIPNVSKLNLVDTTPRDYDPEEDRYGIQKQAERLKTLWDAVEQRRQARREHRRYAAQQQVPQYPAPHHHYSHPIWFPPFTPRPSRNPQRPVSEPVQSATLKVLPY